MTLHQRASIPGIGFQMQDARGVRVEHTIIGYGFKSRQTNHRFAAVELGFLDKLDGGGLRIFTPSL